jgi:hypothetical protein
MDCFNNCRQEVIVDLPKLQIGFSQNSHLVAQQAQNLLSVVVAEFPLDRNAFTLGITVDALLVAAKLWVVAWQQHQACKHAGTKLFEKVWVTKVAIDRPMW